ncbi:hypothetical protein [Nitratidesulfovibrio sp.]|uniref:hypothetical protein n=1 Tax=Nitratidesulfovibrio sp. TaxID=2802297 RepID=UPI003340D20A
MIICVDDTVVGQALAGNPVCVDLIERLANVWRERTHFILLSPKSAVAIKDAPGFHGCSHYYADICRFLIQNFSLLRSVDPYVVFTWDDEKGLLPRGGERVIFSKPKAIFENRREHELYDAFASACAGEALRIGRKYYDPIHGNGDQTHESYKDQLEADDGLAICIVDGDVKCPGGRIRNTAEKVMKLGRNEFVRSVVLEVHELENLIPLAAIKEWYESVGEYDGDRSMVLGILGADEEFRCFIDYKKGLTVKMLNESVGDALLWAFYARAIEAFKCALNRGVDDECLTVECRRCARRVVCRVRMLEKIVEADRRVLSVVCGYVVRECDSICENARSAGEAMFSLVFSPRYSAAI